MTPFNKRVDAGLTADFQCKATGYPVPGISWQKDGRRLPTDNRQVVLQSGELRILHTEKGDEGEYECLAFNVLGVVSAKATLSVRALGRLYSGYE